MGLALGIGEPRTATELAGERLGQIGVEYMALMRKNPSDAEVYKKAIVTAVSRKDSALWNAKETERIFGKFFSAVAEEGL